ncbi:unnamed protein product [Protopolystoma xenopodis]|uniref:Uncharacterized protein n=1 Tax=Protopolystoma xenopodis TaxID=117903 RepID=A0A448WK35_9PLAT|nr:unnamed protein product [Protopolystoma xenopodis]
MSSTARLLCQQKKCHGCKAFSPNLDSGIGRTGSTEVAPNSPVVSAAAYNFGRAKSTSNRIGLCDGGCHVGFEDLYIGQPGEPADIEARLSGPFLSPSSPPGIKSSFQNDVVAAICDADFVGLLLSGKSAYRFVLIPVSYLDLFSLGFEVRRLQVGRARRQMRRLGCS